MSRDSINVDKRHLSGNLSSNNLTNTPNFKVKVVNEQQKIKKTTSINQNTNTSKKTIK